MILQATNIQKIFRIEANTRIDVLRGLNVSVDYGDSVALMGPSGAGKSTLLYILGALDKPDAGSIFYNTGNEELDILKMNDNRLSRFRNQFIGFIFQFHHLLPEFTTLENVMIPGIIAGKSRKTLKSRAFDLLERVGMTHRLEHKPTELSGGEQQRVAIARALINSPKIMLADEPTGNLDSANSRAVLDLLAEIKRDYKLTLLIATHSNEVANFADRICVMGDGVILDERRKTIETSSPENI
jgi:lipoprotein-releasing system ATP-binding protein